jgi:pimeloyl-ACP methyl ester carboxylesterase
MDTTIAAAIQQAYSLIKTGKMTEAQDILVPLVQKHPGAAEAWYMLGLAFTDTDTEKSIHAFQQVILLDPDSNRAHEQIQKILADKEKPAPVSSLPSSSPFTVAPDLSTPASPAIIPPPPIPYYQTPLEVLRQSSSPVPAMPMPVVEEKKEEKEEETPKKKRNFALLVIVVTVLVVLSVIAGLAFYVNSTQVSPALKPTAVNTPIIPTESAKITATPTAYVPVFHAGACPFDVPLGKRVRCGVVRVPQDRSKNLTDLIDLPVVVYQSSQASADAVLFLQGGPGAESLDWSLASFDDYVMPILKDHDMIFFDPRGTGRSKPTLDCPELNTVFLDAYYQNRAEDEAFQAFLNAWNTCHQRFIAAGVNPAAFNTTESAADVHEIVLALGYKQVSLLGISYGTRLGLTVMRDYPEIVRSAVLDSVVPVEGKMFNRRASDTQYALKKLFDDCASSPQCNGAYPELSTVFDQLVDKFDKKPVSIQVTDPTTGFLASAKVNGVDLMSAIVAGMHNSELVPVVPKAIYDIHGGDYTFLSYALGARGGSYKTTGLGTYFSTVCPEQVSVTTAEELDKDLNVSPLIKQFALTGLFGSTQNLFALCKAWDAKPATPQDSAPVTANIPTLIISGQYDPTTPSTTGEMVANDLPKHYFYTIPGMGHGATVGNACAAKIMLAFLNAPGNEPNTSCLTAKPFAFFLPYDGKQPIAVSESSDTVNGVQGVTPDGWKKKLPDGIYMRHAYLFDVTQVQATAYNSTKKIVLEQLEKSFQKEGLSETPRVIDTRVVNKLTWTVYATKFNGEPVIMALAQTSTGRTMVLTMVVSAAERDAFYNGLFIPMLNAMLPLW